MFKFCTPNWIISKNVGQFDGQMLVTPKAASRMEVDNGLPVNADDQKQNLANWLNQLPLVYSNKSSLYKTQLRNFYKKAASAKTMN